MLHCWHNSIPRNNICNDQACLEEVALGGIWRRQWKCGPLASCPSLPDPGLSHANRADFHAASKLTAPHPTSFSPPHHLREHITTGSARGVDIFFSFPSALLVSSCFLGRVVFQAVLSPRHRVQVPAIASIGVFRLLSQLRTTLSCSNFCSLICPTQNFSRTQQRYTTLTALSAFIALLQQRSLWRPSSTSTPP